MFRRTPVTLEPVALYWSLRLSPEPSCRPLVDGYMTLDSGLRRNDVPEITLCLDIFEPKALTGEHQFRRRRNSSQTALGETPEAAISTRVW